MCVTHIEKSKWKEEMGKCNSQARPFNILQDRLTFCKTV